MKTKNLRGHTRPSKPGYTLHLLYEYDETLKVDKLRGRCFLPNRIVNDREASNAYIAKRYRRKGFWI